MYYLSKFLTIYYISTDLIVATLQGLFMWQISRQNHSTYVSVAKMSYPRCKSPFPASHCHYAAQLLQYPWGQSQRVCDTPQVLTITALSQRVLRVVNTVAKIGMIREFFLLWPTWSFFVLECQMLFLRFILDPFTLHKGLSTVRIPINLSQRPETLQRTQQKHTEGQIYKKQKVVRTLNISWPHPVC